MRARELVWWMVGAEIQVSVATWLPATCSPRFPLRQLAEPDRAKESQAATEDPHSAAANCRGHLLVIPLRTLQRRPVGETSLRLHSPLVFRRYL